MQSFKAITLPLLLILALLFLQYRLWFESGGIVDMLRVRKSLAQQTQVNENLKKRNEKLASQIHYLQTNNAAVESKARNELGMIKQDETFYQIIN